MADKHEITFLDHLSLVCDLVTKSCVASTPNKEIIHRDTAGHVTKEGANYLSRKIEEKSGLKSNNSNNLNEIKCLLYDFNIIYFCLVIIAKGPHRSHPELGS